MAIRKSKAEIAFWGVASLLGGLVAGWIDSAAGEVQAPALVLMLVCFALTLPGRAPATLVAILASAGIPLLHWLRLHEANPGFVLVLIPAFLGAGGGRLAGRRLDVAASTLTDGADATSPSQRGLSTRFLLAVSVVIAAATGLSSVVGMLRALDHRAPDWVALVWQIITMLGWIGIARPILMYRKRHTRPPDGTGVIASDLAGHLLTVVVLTGVHATILLGLSAALFIPITPSWTELWVGAFSVYLPLDLLVYLAIHALGAASDADRLQREAGQREAALRASVLDGRLTALRARLNPHFLFNALNSVNVLSRAGRTEDTSHAIDGLTSLLRYVLDERRAVVPLRDELEFVRRYLALQQVRFGTRLTYDIQHDASLDLALVPQLVLQPIVENAVEHGVRGLLDGGTIRITTTRNADTLVLIVEDDGPGASALESSRGIGLASTRERLTTLYGARAALVVGNAGTATGHIGTRAEITLPYELTAPEALAL